jgi:hypothetical protein
VVKPLWGNIHNPNQHGHLKINAKKDITREFLTINHRQMTLYALYIYIIDQSTVKPHINVVVKIEENMSRQITLCREHVMTIGLEMNTKETH